jgi:hypothetical protein
MFTTLDFTPTPIQLAPRFYPTFRDLSAGAQPPFRVRAARPGTGIAARRRRGRNKRTLQCSGAAACRRNNNSFWFASKHCNGRGPRRHSPCLLNPNPFPIPSRYSARLTAPLHAHQKPCVFHGKYCNPSRTLRTEGTHSTNSRVTVPATLDQKPAFSAGNAHFRGSSHRPASPQTGRSPLLAPMFSDPKPCVFPEKYAHHVNSVLSGSSYLQKIPCFPAPNALKTPLHPQKLFSVCTPGADPTASFVCSCESALRR